MFLEVLSGYLIYLVTGVILGQFLPVYLLAYDEVMELVSDKVCFGGMKLTYRYACYGILD